MSNPRPGPGQHAGGQGGVRHERQGARHHHSDRGGGLLGLGPQLGQGQRPLAGTGRHQDPLRDVGVGTRDPGGHRAQVIPGQGGSVEVAAQVIAGLGRPERAVLDALLRHRERERIRAADGGGRVLASLDRGPAEGRRDAADVLGVEHVHRAQAGADRGGQRVDVGLGAGGDDRAGIAQDDIGQERGLEHPRRGHHQQVLLQRDPQRVAVVGTAQEHRVLARVGDPVPQREGRGGSGRSGAGRPGGPSAATGRRGGRSLYRGAAAGAGGCAGAGRGCRAGSGRAGTPR